VSEDWRAHWAPLEAAVGQELPDDGAAAGADVVELGQIRRLLEVLEFDCPLHHDRDVARAHGHADVIAPYSAVTTFAFPPMWAPGDPPNFVSVGADAQPERTVLVGQRTGLEPDVDGVLQADIAMEFVRPITVGDRLSRPGRQRVLGCAVKETRVGRGAFVESEAEVHNQRGEVVTRVRGTIYRYEPHEADRG
jgi:hypothetical protein